jgi:flavin-dependent dehydrogenase
MFPMADVICVGGSVAGAAVAGFLARSGRHVIVLDRAEFPRFKACGEGLLPHGCGVLDRLGVALPEASTITGIRFSLSGGASAWLPFPGRAGRAVSRFVLDEAIRARAMALGVEFVQARALRVEPGRVITDRGMFEAPFLIGADGARSVFHSAFGVRARVPRRRVGFSSHWNGALAEAGEVHVTAFKGGELYVAPVENGLVLASLLLDRRFVLEQGFSVSGMSAFLQERFPEMFGRARRIGPILGAYPLSVCVNRVSGSDWLLVGDAAGSVDAISGEGMSLALRGAEIAADCLVNGWDPAFYAARLRAMRRPIERLTWMMLFLARHPRLAGLAFRFEKSLAPMMRVAVGES